MIIILSFDDQNDTVEVSEVSSPGPAGKTGVLKKDIKAESLSGVSIAEPGSLPQYMAGADGLQLLKSLSRSKGKGPLVVLAPAGEEKELGEEALRQETGKNVSVLTYASEKELSDRIQEILLEKPVSSIVDPTHILERAQKHVFSDDKTRYLQTRKKLEELIKENDSLKQENALYTRVEEELSYLTTFIDSNPAPVIKAGYGGIILDYNAAARHIFENNLRGNSIYKHFTEIDDEKVKNLNPSKPYQFEQRVGNEVFLFTLVKEDSTFSLYFYGSDITGLKEAEAELRESRDSLEEKTQQLALANQELEEFGYSISHDLRNPLHHILGYSALVLEDYSEQLDEQGIEHLERIVKVGKRMDQLIDKMMELAYSTGKELHKETLDLSSMASAIATTLKTTEPERDAEFSIARGLTAVGDRRLLQSALENLIGNAWKFTRTQARAKIEFCTECDDQRTIFYVRDNGVGFDMAHAQRLFKTFQRLPTQGDFEGSGIGLSSVKRIIERHGGRIWARGEPGKGATFYFTLA